ncbi:hypothetical protein Q8X48_28885 [Pseudomonas sp. QLc11A]|uniref:YobI-like P-loop NTPase domain-containing protein n=1 Tax=Pseudomonas azerbaijanorientalis TaxID=2842350 RepID=A0ABW8WCQ0_9PSED
MKLLKSLFEKIRETKKIRRAQWLLSRDEATSESFLDLTPVDNADIDGLYRKALDFAMRNPSIRNVALTGPYGSGKTSVIKTYEKNSPFRFLNVSLATFSDPNISSELDSAPTSEEVTVKVERSILQQMLYGADSRTLPYSRFKRITKPSWLTLNALGFAFWIVVCGYIYRERENILSVATLDDVKPLWFFTCLYAFSYFAQLVSRSLKASHSLSVKKLSLQNGEVELDGTPESSILNKHLDEIIYFFEENNYDVVVFEDLDRFGSPEIFIKLREINKIINDRPKQKRMLDSLRAPQPLKFIYAIKDDVFFNKDRAKFFDFITPIIPIINNSNSREMFARCIVSNGKNIEIDNRFLSEVSLYLDDYRLIKNISNEFLVYQGKVGGVPNLNKLLAIIIYKNTYPKDFEALHHGKGALYSIVGLRTDLIARASVDADIKIDALRTSILESEAEFCSAQADLVRIFWGQLCGGNADYHINGIYAGSEILTLDKLLDWDNFKKLFNENPVRINGMLIQNSYFYAHPNQQIALGLSFRELESKAIPGSKFEVRNERIKNKSALRRNQLNAEISDIKEEKAEFARQPLRQLLMNANEEIDSAIAGSDISDSRLLKYLVKNGFLDETYHLYISIFHEGRMSRNDWNFIQMIRDFRPVDPDAQIDNPREVVAEMRDEDFGAEYVLNVTLMDYLLSTGVVNFSKIRSAIEFVARHFSGAEEFFRAYWLSGRAVDAFMKAVSEHWSGYGVASIGSDQSPRHIANLLAYVDPSYIAQKMNMDGALTRYLSTHSASVFAENVSFANGYQALKFMSVKLENLQEIGELDELAAYACQNSLYLLSENNIEFALSNLSHNTNLTDSTSIDHRLSNYTAISLATDQTVNNYVWKNINSYLEDVALIMENNLEESKEAILKVVNHPEINQDLAIQYALRQSCIFESFTDIPEFMWGELLFNKKIIVEWKNILEYHRHEGTDLTRLSAFLNDDEVVNELTGALMPMADGDDEDGKALSRFVINNTDIDLSNFEKLCGCSRYAYLGFSTDLPLDRKLILARIGKISLNENSFAETSDSPLLKATLIKTHFASYTKQADKYPIDLDVKLELLALSSENNKAQIVKWMTLEELQASANATNKVARFLSAEGLNIDGYNREVVVHCLANGSLPRVAVDLLYNFIDILTNIEITGALSAAQEPYCQFVKANTRQKLFNTERNMEFVLKLVRRKIISSISDEGSFIRVNAYRKGITKFLLGDS